MAVVIVVRGFDVWGIEFSRCSGDEKPEISRSDTMDERRPQGLGIGELSLDALDCVLGLAHHFFPKRRAFRTSIPRGVRR